jgi:hypothetical protein
LQLSLAKNSFEKNHAGASQLFRIMLSRLPPLLEMSLEQAPTLVRLVNIVRSSGYAPSRIDGLPQQVFLRHSQPLRTLDRIRQLHLLLKVSIFSRAATATKVRWALEAPTGTSSLPDD